MEEIWKDIKEYEGLYQVSNLGRIKSIKNNIILKQSNIYNYKYVSLCKNGIRKNVRVHKLVATAFISKDDYKKKQCEDVSQLDISNLDINHIDGNKQNNCSNNLEWCTKKHNMTEAYKLGLLKNNLKPQFGNNNGMSKRVQQYSLEGVLLKEYEYMTKASEKLNISVSAICLCCKGIRKTAGGYIWKYER